MPSHGGPRRAAAGVAGRHEPLRIRFVRGEDGPVPVIDAEPPLDWADVQGDAIDGTMAEGAAMERLTADAGMPFDLERGPLLRGRFFRLAGGRHLLGPMIHHIACSR